MSKSEIKFKLLKFPITLVFICFFQNYTFCQGNARANTPSFTNQASQSGLNGYNRAMRTLSNMSAQYRYRAVAETYNEIDGSPYFMDDYVEATLVQNDGSLIQDIKIKVDQYVDEIVALNKEQEEVILDSRFYMELFFDKEGKHYSFKKVNPKEPNQFQEILYESDNVILFKKQEAKLRKGENIGISKTKSIFKKQIKYYLVKRDERIRVHLKKKNLFSQFPIEDASSIKKFIDNNNIILSKSKDYLELFSLIMDEKRKAPKTAQP